MEQAAIPQGPQAPGADRSFIKRKFLDVPYAGLSPAQKLDLYLPEKGEGPFPAVITIHGGAFCMCDKSDLQVQPFLRGIARGYAVASLNYRLSGEALFPAGVQDVQAALRFLRAHAAEYCLDPDRFAVAGGSSGGNYAAMLCALSGTDRFCDPSLGYPEYGSEVQAGVIWFPPTDFLKMDEQLRESGLGPCDHNEADSPESRYLGGKITELEPACVQRANPMTYVGPGIPPMLVQHGRRDHIVPWQQSAIFVQKVREAAGADRVVYEILEEVDHADPLFETAENMEKVFAFLDGALKISQRPGAGCPGKEDAR